MVLWSRPSGQPCIETKEFDLVRNMLIAAVEERYRDAGILLPWNYNLNIGDLHWSPNNFIFLTQYDSCFTTSVVLESWYFCGLLQLNGGTN